MRFCVDYKSLNKITVKDEFPILTFNELFDELNDTHYFSKIDIQSEFHQIYLSFDAIHTLVFYTHDGHYEFLVMSFGLCNAPSMFQSTMNVIFRDHLQHSILVFFDDIFIYNDTWENHLIRLHYLLATLWHKSLIAKDSKCDFVVESILYHNHFISGNNISIDQTKNSAIINEEILKYVCELHGFLGLVRYYQWFLKHYMMLAVPLTNLLCKNQFIWTDESTKAFKNLRNTIPQHISSTCQTLICHSLLNDTLGATLGVVLQQ